MSDYLVNLAKSNLARKAVRTLGLPIPMPMELRRLQGADPAEPLSGRVACLHGNGAVMDAVRAALELAGAEVVGADVTDAVDLLVMDAGPLSTPASLRRLYDFFHPRVPHLNPHGRVLVLGRVVADWDGANDAAAQRALLGFVKSLGKEVGRRACTANLIRVTRGAEDRLAGPLVFFASPRAAFVSGQEVVVDRRARGKLTKTGPMPLQDKVALVTGAARGIGAAIARRLGQEGATLVLVDRPEGQAGLDELLKEFAGSSVATDLAADGAVREVLEHVLQIHGRVDVLVNNAGVTRDRTLAKMNDAWWDLCLDVNLEAACQLTSVLAQEALGSGGRVVHISSIGGIAGNPGQTNYAASKAGLIGHAESMAGLLSRRGITVNCVAPGFIETAMTAAMPAGPREAGRRLNALSQGGAPQDIADAVTFLSSPASLGVTGQVLRVCGLHVAGA